MSGLGRFTYVVHVGEDARVYRANSFSSYKLISARDIALRIMSDTLVELSVEEFELPWHVEVTVTHPDQLYDSVTVRGVIGITQ